MERKLKQSYENAVNAILRAFCDKHDFDYLAADWVGNEVGDIACVADYFVGMQTMIHDLSSNAPEEDFFEWHDYILQLESLGIRNTPTFKHWIMGCSRKSEAEMEELWKAHQRIDEAKMMLEDLIKTEWNDFIKKELND